MEQTGMSTFQPHGAGRKLQPRRETCRRYGVCDRTVARWESSPDLGFPRPTVINGRKYDNPDDLDVFDAAMSAKGRAA
jgi:hypothetical protein